MPDVEPFRASSFEPVLPAVRPDLIAAAEQAHVHVGDAVRLLRDRASGVTADEPCEVVAWAWVVDRTVSHVLLVDHPGYGSWRPPGGRAMPDETVTDAARRELREETGLDAYLLLDRPALVDAHPHVTPAGRPTYSFGFASLFVADPARPVVGERGQAAAWFAIASPPERRSASHWARVVASLDLAREAVRTLG